MDQRYIYDEKARYILVKSKTPGYGGVLFYDVMMVGEGGGKRTPYSSPECPKCKGVRIGAANPQPCSCRGRVTCMTVGPRRKGGVCKSVMQ